MKALIYKQMFCIIKLVIIMKIEKLVKVGSKYKITLDDGKELFTYDDVILKNGLLYHRYINDKLLDKIYNDTVYYKYYNKVLDMISRRLRSEYEIKEYLNKTDIKNEDIINIIDNLKSIGLINDEAYAKAYTNDKINLSLDGPYKIKNHLKKCKIDEDIINNVIYNIDENVINNHIDKTIEKKIRSNKKYTPYILKQKITVYLINLGYDKDDIINRLNTFKIKSINLDKEMDREYNKLKRKYEGREFEYKLKTKLYSKGFKADEIEEYIKKAH